MTKLQCWISIPLRKSLHAVTIRSCDTVEQHTVSAVHKYSVTIRKSGRVRGVRHVAQIKGTNNSHQTVPGIPDGKSKFGRAANGWENINNFQYAEYEGWDELGRQHYKRVAGFCYMAINHSVKWKAGKLLTFKSLQTYEKSPHETEKLSSLSKPSPNRWHRKLWIL